MPSSGDPTAQTLLGHLTDRAGAHDIGDLTLDDSTALANLAASTAFAGQYEPLTLIDSQQVTGSAAQVTFSDIPQTFADLVFVISAMPTGAATNLVCRFNGSNTAGDYIYQRMVASSTSVSSAAYTNEVSIRVGTLGAATNYRCAMQFDVIDYAATDTYKTARSSFSSVLAATPTFEIGGYHAWYKSLSAITSAVFSLNSTTGLVVGSKIWLYGRGTPLPLA